MTQPKPEPKKRQMKHLREMRKRDPNEWVDLIVCIRDKRLRAHVACIVWWDFFAKRKTCDSKWNHEGGRRHIDRFKDEYDDYYVVNPVLIQRELLRLGYTEYRAWYRSGVDYDWHESRTIRLKENYDEDYSARIY